LSGTALAFLICLLVIAVFIPEPKPFQIFVFRVVLALAAAGFGATIPGFLKVELPLWKKGLISATRAIALFVVVYKVNPQELIHQPAPPGVVQKMKQPLSGVIVDENGNPLPDVKVMIQGFDVEKMTNAKGSFSFEIEAEKEQSVKLIVQKQGFETTHQYVSLGNTSVSLPMKKKGQGNDIEGKWNKDKAKQIVMKYLNDYGDFKKYGVDCGLKKRCEVIHQILGEYNIRYNHKETIMVVASTTTKENVCHACGHALSFIEFVRNENGWNIGAINMNAFHWGQWGEINPEEIKVLAIGENIFGVIVITEGGNQGISVTATEIHAYIGDEFREIFSAITSTDDSG